jgi:hypothetical protein
LQTLISSRIGRLLSGGRCLSIDMMNIVLADGGPGFP